MASMTVQSVQTISIVPLYIVSPGLKNHMLFQKMVAEDRFNCIVHLKYMCISFLLSIGRLKQTIGKSYCCYPVSEQSLSSEEDVQQLRRGTADLRNNIAAHGPRIHRLSGTDYYPPDGRRASEHHNPRHVDNQPILEEPELYRGNFRERDPYPSRSRGGDHHSERIPDRRPSRGARERRPSRSPDRRDIYDERPRHPPVSDFSNIASDYIVIQLRL